MLHLYRVMVLNLPSVTSAKPTRLLLTRCHYTSALSVLVTILARRPLSIAESALQIRRLPCLNHWQK